MLWLAGGLFLFFRWFARKFLMSKWTWWLPFAFLTLAVASFAFAPIPLTDLSLVRLAAWLVEWVFNFAGPWIQISGQVLAGVLLFCICLVGIADLVKDKKPDGCATTMVYTAPVLALVASGPFAPYILNFVQAISGVGPTLVNTLAA